MQHHSGIAIVLSPDVCRQARDMANMSAQELAFVAGVPRSALDAFENNGGEAHPYIDLKLRRALERAAVKFFSLAGVLCASHPRPRRGSVESEVRSDEFSDAPPRGGHP